MPGFFEIRRVENEAASEVLNILHDAAVWLNSKGFEQWRDFLDFDKAKKILEKRFAEGEVYLASLDGIPAATITLQWTDDFWGELGKDSSAGYIHSMAVRRDYAGRGLGREVLAWADGYFEKAGKLRTRLDCLQKNTSLCRYYDDLGFRTIGQKDWQAVPLLLKERSWT